MDDADETTPSMSRPSLLAVRLDHGCSTRWTVPFRNLPQRMSGHRWKSAATFVLAAQILLLGSVCGGTAFAQYYYYGGPRLPRLPLPPPPPVIVDDFGPPYTSSGPYSEGRVFLDGAGLWGGPETGPWEAPGAPYTRERYRSSSVPHKVRKGYANQPSQPSGTHGKDVLARIDQRLRELGLRQIAAPRRKDRVYIIAATERNGRRHRVIFDAHNGALMENRPLGNASPGVAPSDSESHGNLPKGTLDSAPDRKLGDTQAPDGKTG